MLLFPDVARRVKDRYAAEYTEANFTDVMSPMVTKMKQGLFSNPGNSHKLMHESLLKALQTDFKL